MKQVLVCVLLVAACGGGEEKTACEVSDQTDVCAVCLAEQCCEESLTCSPNSECQTCAQLNICTSDGAADLLALGSCGERRCAVPCGEPVFEGGAGGAP